MCLGHIYDLTYEAEAEMLDLACIYRHAKVRTEAGYRKGELGQSAAIFRTIAV